MAVRPNALDQQLDIKGTLNSVNTKTLTDESSSFGSTSASGTGDTVGGAAPSMTLTDAGGAFTAQDVGRYITIVGATTGANDGSFHISAFSSSTVITYQNASGVAEAFSGTYTVRDPYSLEDDINFTRTDRKLIKGTASHTTAIPTYQRPTAIGTNVDANLINIASKTTDAKALVTNHKFENAVVADTNTFITITSAGNLPWANVIDRTGVPIWDGADAGDHEATYVEIIDNATGQALTVSGAGTARVFGRARSGSSVDGNSIEIEFRQVVQGAALSTSSAFTWTSTLPTTIDLFYPHRQRLDQLDENALRTTLVHGIIGDAGIAQDINEIHSVLGMTDGDTFLTGLTNTANFFVFSTLDGTPTATETLNVLNAQIGTRDYTGTYLTDGQTITASLQALSVAVASVGFNTDEILTTLEANIVCDDLGNLVLR